MSVSYGFIARLRYDVNHLAQRLVLANSDESYETCLRRMQQSHVRHLIVLDQNRMSGVVSLRDLMAVDLNEKAEELSLLNAYVHHIPGPAPTS